MFRKLLWFMALCSPLIAQANQLLLPRGAQWRYLSGTVAPAASWRTTNFSDSAWPLGNAPLGYGDGDEATVISSGADASNKPITTWFRHQFFASDAASIEQLSFALQCDDGAVVYLNGTEVFRRNMPSGTILPDTRATTSVGDPAEDAYVVTQTSASLLAEGLNVLAVELHQSSPSSSDISFDLELTAELQPLQLSALTQSNTPPVLHVTVGGERESEVTVTFYGRKTATKVGPDFTLVALPDTQYYVSSKNGGQPSQMVAQMDWLLANREPLNIPFVTQLGDCVENGDNGGNDIEWRHATNAFYRLENPVLSGLSQGIPYGIAVGNHDQSPMGSANGSSIFYNTYFGAPHFSPYAYYGDHYGTNNDNHFELFSASGLDFIILHLEFDPAANTNVLNWADSVLKAYPNRRAILVSHYLIEVGNPADFGVQGQATYDALKDNPNLFLMLCGHVPGEGRRTDVYQGNTVHTVLSDYQGRARGGDGWLRLLQFSPSNNVIRVRTYSPTLNQFETDADSEFVLDCNLGDPFDVIGTVPLADGESTASLNWSDLEPGTDYEWYGSATDGVRAGESAMEHFHYSLTTDALGGTHPEEGSARITSYKLIDGSLELTWNAHPINSYRVYASDSCTGSSWIAASPELSTMGTTLSYLIPVDSLATARFFRIEETK